MKKIINVTGIILGVILLPVFIGVLVHIGVRLDTPLTVLYVNAIEPILMSEYLSLMVAIIGIVVTAYFSYKLYKISKSSADLESNKTKHEIMKAAGYLYTDLMQKSMSASKIFHREIEENIRLSSRSFEETMEFRKDYITYYALGGMADEWKEHLSTVQPYLGNEKIDYYRIIDVYTYYETAQRYMEKDKLRASIISLRTAKLIDNELESIWENSDENLQEYISLAEIKSESQEINSRRAKCISNSQNIVYAIEDFIEDGEYQVIEGIDKYIFTVILKLKEISTGKFDITQDI